MSKTYTSGLGLPQWSLDSDPAVTRGDLNAAFAAIDPVGQAYTAYTPTFGNITGGGGTFAFSRVGKKLFLHYSFSTGTAIANTFTYFSLPAGNAGAAIPQGVTGFFASGGFTSVQPAGAYVAANDTSVQLFSPTGALFGAGASLNGYFGNLVIEVA